MTCLDLRTAVLLVCVFLAHWPVDVDASAVAWNYANNSDHGPAHWKYYFPDCAGVVQSPIDIATRHVLYDPDLKYFDMTDYSKIVGVHMSLHNVGGHTAEVKYSGTPLYLKGGNLPDVYQVDQFHFHWGRMDSRGSEHSVDNSHFPMEMHIVHHQARLVNISSAMLHPHGLAVLGLFFKVGAHNPHFEPLLKNFDRIDMPGNHTDIPTFKLLDLLPKPETGGLDYYRYMGSLTTPPCYESVIWSLARKPIEISEEQINKFRNLHKDISSVLVDDYRPIQDRHSRTVTTTVDKYVDDGSAHASSGYEHASLLSIAMMAMVSIGNFLLRVL